MKNVSCSCFLAARRKYFFPFFFLIRPVYRALCADTLGFTRHRAMCGMMRMCCTVSVLRGKTVESQRSVTRQLSTRENWSTDRPFFLPGCFIIKIHQPAFQLQQVATCYNVIEFMFYLGQSAGLPRSIDY